MAELRTMSENTGFQKVLPGEPVKIIRGTAATLKCCDCGMVHLVAYEIDADRNLILRFWREEVEKGTA
jgi:hypothetical protein